jgi:phosphate transport system protein
MKQLPTTLSSGDPQADARTVAVMQTVAVVQGVEEQVLQMFTLVADGIAAATSAFLGADVEAARRLVKDDPLLNDLQHRIESSVERRLLSADPLTPHDTRAMLAVLRIVPELERTGDLVEHIALRTPQGLATEIPQRCRALVEEMGLIAAEMWRLAADAYADSDGSAAARLRQRDDVLDELHVSLTSQLASSPISVAIAIEMGLVARFYERLGDHAVNVARRVQDVAQLGDRSPDG